MRSESINLPEWRERAEFWASRDPDSGLYDPNAVAFAKEVVTLLDRLREVLHERNEWRDQVVVIRGQQRDALARADRAERALAVAKMGSEARKARETAGKKAIAAFASFAQAVKRRP